MAEQILHGSNVVTAAEQGRRERALLQIVGGDKLIIPFC